MEEIANMEVPFTPIRKLRLMRLTEYIDFITRTDIGSAQNPKPNDYTHFVPKMIQKRHRYLYQCKRKGKEPVK